jgi:hypothetical protein
LTPSPKITGKGAASAIEQRNFAPPPPQGAPAKQIDPIADPDEADPIPPPVRGNR